MGKGCKEKPVRTSIDTCRGKFVRTLGGVNKQRSVLKTQSSGFAREAWVDRPVNQPW